MKVVVPEDEAADMGVAVGTHYEEASLTDKPSPETD
jgi:hypothetical protein